MIGNHQISRGKPLFPGRLRGHPAIHVIGVHASCGRPPEAELIGQVNNDPRPIRKRFEKRSLYYCHLLNTLQLGPDPAEYQWVSNRLQLSKLCKIGEDDPRQRGSINCAVLDDVGPPFRHRCQSRSFEDTVADSVGIDGVDPEVVENPAYLAFTGADATAQKPSTLPGRHELRR